MARGTPPRSRSETAPRGRRPASLCDSALRSFASISQAGAHSPARAPRCRTTYSWSPPALGRGGIRCCHGCLACITCARSTTRRACAAGWSPAVRLAIVGAGLIGAEVASTVRALGIAPTLIEAGPTPLVRAFGSEVGALSGRALAKLPEWRPHRRAGRCRPARPRGRADRTRAGRRHLDRVRPRTGLDRRHSRDEARCGHLDLAPDGGIATDACGRRPRPPACSPAGMSPAGIATRSAAGSAPRTGRAPHSQAAIVARTILGHGPPANDATPLCMVRSVRVAAAARQHGRGLAARRDRARGRGFRGALPRLATGTWSPRSWPTGHEQVAGLRREPGRSGGRGVGCGR